MATEFDFDVGARGKVTALVYRAEAPKAATLILAHGAGAPQRHPFMVDIATRIANRGIDVVTFDFPYAQAGRKMPDRHDVLGASWCAAIATVRARMLDRPARLFIGGKSMGGRIAAHVAADEFGAFQPVDGAITSGSAPIAGLVFLGFPLHPLNDPKTVRDVPRRVALPMLFVQGTRDALGTAKEIGRHFGKLANVRIHAIDEGDHSLALPKRLGEARQTATLDGAADAIARFVDDPSAPIERTGRRATGIASATGVTRATATRTTRRTRRP